MDIPRISGIGRVTPSTADTPAPNTLAAAIRASLAVPAVEIDAVTQQPMPPRFPWLSRLSQQLESAAKQRPAFAPAPMLGDHLDQSA